MPVTNVNEVKEASNANQVIADSTTHAISTVGPPSIGAPFGTLILDRDGVSWMQVSPCASGYSWIRWLGGPTTLKWIRCSQTLRALALSSTITQPVTTNDVRYFTPFVLRRPCIIHGLGWPVSVAGGGAGDTIEVKAAIYTSLRTGGEYVLPEKLQPNAIFEAITGGVNGQAAIGGTSTGLQYVPLKTLTTAGIVFKTPGYFWIVGNYGPNSGTPPTPEGFTMSAPLPFKRGRSMTKTFSSELFADTLINSDTADAATTTPAATDWGILIEESY